MSENDRRRIAFLYSANGYGGMLRNLELILTNLDLNRFEPFVFLLTSSTDSRNELDLGTRATEISVEKIPDSSAVDFKALAVVDSRLRNLDIHVLSCHGFKADGYGWALRKFYAAPVRLFSIAHGWIDSSLKLGLYNRFDRKILRGFDRVVLVSEAQRRELSWQAANLSVVENAVDPQLFMRARDQQLSRSDLGLTENSFVFISVGRLSEEKCHAVTLAAFAEVSRSFDGKYRLLIAGDGAERTALVRLSEQLSIQDRVMLLGHRSDVAGLYSLADAFVSSSRIEGMPNAVLEAQSLELPCILSDIPAHRRLANGGETALLFERGEMLSLAGAMRQVMSSPALRVKMQQSARDFVSAQFSMRERMKKLEALYLGV